MPMSIAAVVISDVLGVAPLYGVVAIGFVLVYRFTGVLNFAHGSLVALGAYCAYVAWTHFGISSVPVLVAVSMVVGAGIGGLLYAILIRYLIGRPTIAIVLVTIAVGIVLNGLMQMVFTSAPLTVPNTEFAAQLTSLPGGITMSYASAVLLAIYVCLVTDLPVVLRYSRLGIQSRAAGEDPKLASYRGINVHVVFASAWAAATLAAFSAGTLYSMTHPVSISIGILAFKGFPAAMVGGMDSIRGTLVGAVIVATGEALAFQFVNSLLSDVVPFAIMIIVLFVRPWGLFGTRELIDRV